MDNPPVRFALFALAACSSSAPPPACGTSTQQPIVNGTPHESYLGLSPAQIAAIVQVVDATQPNGALCSGAFVAPEWVVTARHCLEIPSISVVLQGDASSPITVLPVVATVAHPTEEVALLNVDLSGRAAATEAGSFDARVADAASIDADSVGDGWSIPGATDAGLTGVNPIRPGAASIGQLGTGDVVELAGYGLTEAGAVRSLRFLAEPIIAIDGSAITVSGFGETGACEGDSGGPLLVRAPDGTPLVAGVLFDGSTSCVEQDSYTRLDVVGDWIVSIVGSAREPDRDCGSITAEGRCLYGSALWCAGSELASQACSGRTHCGWDRGPSGFRCVDAATDPCVGVDSIGACQGDVALSCSGGSLREETCSPCNACRIDGETGGPACVAAPSSK